MKQKITNKTKIGPNGYSYTYRNHLVTIEAGFCQLTAEIRFDDRVVRSGACGYGLKSAVEKINRIIDNDITENN